MGRLRIAEIFLIQVIFYAVIWLIDEYVASYLCLILPVVIAVILALSAVVDWIEPARIGTKYYYVMMISIITPLLVAFFFYTIYEGNIAWLRE